MDDSLPGDVVYLDVDVDGQLLFGEILGDNIFFLHEGAQLRSSHFWTKNFASFSI